MKTSELIMLLQKSLVDNGDVIATTSYCCSECGHEEGKNIDDILYISHAIANRKTLEKLVIK